VDGVELQLASAEPSSCVVTCERENSSMQHLHHEEVLNLPQDFHPAIDLQMKLHVDGIQDEAIDLKVRFELITSARSISWTTCSFSSKDDKGIEYTLLFLMSFYTVCSTI
jgi:hypothetical protein